MKFRDYAANETSLLVSRLLAKRSKQCVSDLKAYRQALDEAARAFESTLSAPTKVDQDGELADVVERLNAAAVAQAQAVSQREKAEAQTIVDAVRKEIEAARKELEEHARVKAAVEAAKTAVDAELKHLRKELQEQTHAKSAADAANSALEDAKAALDRDLKQVRKELQEEARARAAVDDAKAALDKDLKQVRKELQQEQTSAKAALDAAKTALDSETKQLRKELQEQTYVRTAVDAANAALDKDVKQFRKELQEQTAAKAALETANATLDKDLKQLRKDLPELTRAKASVEAAKASLDAELKDLRTAHAAQVKSLERANSYHERARADLQAELDARVAADATLRQRVADAERELQHSRGEAQATAHDAAQAASSRETPAVALLDRLLTVSQSMATGGSIDDVMTALVNALATDFLRVARFRVKGKRLEGVHQIGFDFKSDISKVAIPLTMDSLVTRALASDKVESFAVRELADNLRPPLGGNPESALALPIKVHDETVAVIYAEESHDPEDAATFDQRAKVAELLRRQVVPILEKLTLEPKVLAELHAYATLLLDEIEHMYTSDVSLGKKPAELKADLKSNLQCAREIYGQRVASQGPAAAAVLDDRLSTLLDARAATPFGRELAAVAGKTVPDQKPSSRSAAHAS